MGELYTRLSTEKISRSRANFISLLHYISQVFKGMSRLFKIESVNLVFERQHGKKFALTRDFYLSFALDFAGFWRRDAGYQKLPWGEPYA